jgi:hypothetical protein
MSAVTREPSVKPTALPLEPGDVGLRRASAVRHDTTTNAALSGLQRAASNDRASTPSAT